VLLPKTAEKILLVQKDLLKQGYSLKIWDAYRPESAQDVLKKYAKENGIPDVYFADDSKHSKGTAVDVTLVNAESGMPIEMPSDFDDFTGKGNRGSKMSAEAAANLKILTDTMKKYGFRCINIEWWHYDLPNTLSYPSFDYDLAKTFPDWIIE
ncbi:MAG TPA: M15 family metallopeptidase, partial [Clostridia bacterium]|nr:M15 family metallopeptidase [Clostridia bacterium]